MVGDAIQVAPNSYKTVFENDRVRLLEYRGGPGNKTEMHSHPDVLAYAVVGGKFKFTHEDGQSFEAELGSGESMFVEGENHATENTGSTNAHILLVELK